MIGNNVHRILYNVLLHSKHVEVIQVHVAPNYQTSANISKTVRHTVITIERLRP